MVVQHANDTSVEAHDSEAAGALQHAVGGLANRSRRMGEVVLCHTNWLGPVRLRKHGESTPDALLWWEQEFNRERAHLDHPRCERGNEKSIDARLGSSKVVEVVTSQHEGLGRFESNDPTGSAVRFMYEGKLTDELARLYDAYCDHVPRRRRQLYFKSAMLQQVETVPAVTVIEDNLPAPECARPHVRHHGVTLLRSEHIEKR